MMGKRTAALALVCAGILLCAGCEGRTDKEEPDREASEIQTLLLVTAQDARASVAETERMPFGGLLVEGDGASYTGAFNAVFGGNLEFSFGFCAGDPAAYRRFTFTFASSVDPEVMPAENAFVAVLVGLASGLGAVGVHQVGKQIEKAKEDSANDDK